MVKPISIWDENGPVGRSLSRKFNTSTCIMNLGRWDVGLAPLPVSHSAVGSQQQRLVIKERSNLDDGCDGRPTYRVDGVYVAQETERN